MMKDKKRLSYLIIIVFSIISFLIIGLILNIQPNALEDKLLTKKQTLHFLKQEIGNYEKEIVFKTNDKNVKDWLKKDGLSYNNLGEINYYNYNSSKIQYYHYPEYTEVHLTISYKLNKKQMNYVNKTIKKIAKKCKGKTIEDSVKKVNNYYKNKLSYKQGQNSIYKGLKNGEGNCYTYTMLTKLTLDELNIKNVTTYGTVKNSSHIWNKVKIGNTWKYLDVTFNDILNDKYLLISKTKILKTHKILTRSK